MTDPFIVRSVVFILGLFANVGLLGTVWLVSTNTPGEKVAIVSGLTATALGAIGALLVSTRSGAEAPSVTVAGSVGSVDIPQPAEPALDLVEPGGDVPAAVARRARSSS